jgi:NDP-sugar pyrophosphorylase family protein
MRVVLLVGGMGTRLVEEAEIKPKSMVGIGGFPVLWHIMKGYSHSGSSEFMVALGYKGDVAKRYFLDHAPLHSHFSMWIAPGYTLRQALCREDWTIHFVRTGLPTNTGGWLKRLRELAGSRHVHDAPRRRRHFLAGRTDGTACSRRPIDGLSPRRFLAGHGYAARRATPSSFVEQMASSMARTGGTCG